MSITPIVDGIIIGKWISAIGGSQLIVISKANNSYLMISISADESEYTKTLDVELIDGEERLYLYPRTGYNDYLVIKDNGNLAFYDDLGFIQVLQQR